MVQSACCTFVPVCAQNKLALQRSSVAQIHMLKCIARRNQPPTEKRVRIASLPRMQQQGDSITDTLDATPWVRPPKRQAATCACKATYNTVVHFNAVLLTPATSNAELMTGAFALGHTSQLPRRQR